MRRIGRVFAALVFLASGASAQEIGPARGSLVIVGGGAVGREILTKFAELASGFNSPIVVIPTAGEDSLYPQDWSGLRMFRDAGFTNLTVLHTRDPRKADEGSFVAPIRVARGVWFSGGRQWRIADAYLGTRTEKELRAVLDRGGVIGGTSAGATIQGSYLARGDTRNNTIMMGDHEVGFGYLKNVAIDQHLLRRNRQFDLIPVIEKHPELLGIGIDESTAIVVRGDTAEVIGPSYVAVFDIHRVMGPGGRFYFLQNGDRLNLRTREPSRQSVIPAAWPAKQDWPRP